MLSWSWEHHKPSWGKKLCLICTWSRCRNSVMSPDDSNKNTWGSSCDLSLMMTLFVDILLLLLVLVHMNITKISIFLSPVLTWFLVDIFFSLISVIFSHVLSYLAVFLYLQTGFCPGGPCWRLRLWLSSFSVTVFLHWDLDQWIWWGTNAFFFLLQMSHFFSSARWMCVWECDEVFLSRRKMNACEV